MEIKMENLNGIVLKTAGKRTSEDITVNTGLTKYAGAYEYTVTSKVAPSDLTGYTVTVPSGWTATAGYGEFYVDYESDVLGSWYMLCIGYGMVDREVGMPYYDKVANYISPGETSYISEPNANEFSITITGGDDATNADLIEWFVDNNATFSKKVVGVLTDGNKISNKSGIVLKTANTYFEEDITVTLDESMFATGYTVTLVWSANRGESAGYSASYTADNGESGTLSIDNANVTLTNVTSLTLNLPAACYSFANSTTGNLNSNIGENIIEITEDQTITVFVSNATGGGSD